MNAQVTIGEKEYRLSFTVSAAKEVSKRYGGMEQMSNALSEGDTADRLSEIAWLVTLLANQAIRQDNLREKKNDPLLNVEDVELLTEVQQISAYTEAVFSCFRTDTERHVADDTSDGTEDGEEKEKNP